MLKASVLGVAADVIREGFEGKKRTEKQNKKTISIRGITMKEI